MKLFHKILVGFVVLAPFAMLVSCSDTIEESDDYQNITSTLSLSSSYEDTEFYDDGISLATVKRYTDGDTTTFEDSTGDSYTIRYACINTPESTTKVQKWGKAASLFTKEKLSNAYEIVIQGTTTPPSLDSNGTRYLGYVWYRDSSSDSFKCLNLEIVENGYSKSTSSASDSYYSYFKEAQSFASEYDLRLWGDDEDEYYNDTPISTTLQEIDEDLESDSPTLYDSETTVGKRVSFTAYITERYTSSSIYYFEAEAEGDDGETYSMTLLAGYSSDSIVDVLKIGFEYKFVGAVSYYNSNYQIAIGGTYNSTTFNDGVVDEDATELVQKDYYVVFDSDNSRLSKSTETAVYSDLTVTSLSLDDSTLTITGTAYPTDDETDAVTFTITVELSDYSNYNSDKLYVGLTFSLSGIQAVYDSYNLTVSESTISNYLTN